MAEIYQSKNFIVESFDTPTPHVSREEGGHIRIKPKVDVLDRGAVFLERVPFESRQFLWID